jgi:hypothetical protein
MCAGYKKSSSVPGMRPPVERKRKSTKWQFGGAGIAVNAKLIDSRVSYRPEYAYSKW